MARPRLCHAPAGIRPIRRRLRALGGLAQGQLRARTPAEFDAATICRLGEEGINAGILAHLDEWDTLHLDHRNTPLLVGRGADPESLMLDVHRMVTDGRSGAGGSRPNRTKVYSVRLSAEEEHQIQHVAQSQHPPASTLVRSWILERLDRERSA